MQPTKRGQGRAFHLLTEAEPFSEHNGGAISRWVANVLRTDAESIVIAPSADGTWSYPAERVRCVTRLQSYARLSERAGPLLRWPLRRWLLRRALRPALDDLRPGDIVWVHNRPEFAAALGWLVRARGARLILHLHNSHLVHWPERMVYAIGADAHVFVSRFLMQQAQERFPGLGRCEVLQNGADRSIFYPRFEPDRTAGPPVVLFAGRLVPDKGLHVFLAAMRLVKSRGGELEGIVLGGVGFGASKPTKYLRAMQQNAPSNVGFQPYCSGAALGETFRAADIACVPSCWQDPMPLVVVEAMASGLPVVGSRSGGIPEMLADGGGVLVDRGSVSQLADALEMLAGNNALRRRLAQEAYASFRMSFTWDVVRGNYRRILDAVHQEKAVPGDVRESVRQPATVEVECNGAPDISVVIPTQARPQMLCRAIKSVLAQTMQHFEIVVVLDGEDRVTAKAVERIADPRIRLVCLDSSVGGAEARNLGVLNARGRYIALLDDDDEWLPGKLEAQLALAEVHGSANVAVVTQYVYRVEGQPDEVWPARLPRVGEPLSEFLFSSRGGFQTSTYLCPRDLLLRVPFTRGLKKHQDWDWFLQLAARPGFELLIVPEPLSIYWVPQRGRTSISGDLDWEFSHRWATARRALMTRKAYSRFLVKICTRSAMLQKAGPSALLRLVRDVVFLGLPTPFLMAEFMVCVMLPDGLRLRLRPIVQSMRRPHPRPVAG